MTPAHDGSAPGAPFDVAAARARIRHVDDFVHVNNASGSLPDASVHEAMRAHLDAEARLGSTEAMLAAGDVLEDLYGDIAALCGVEPDRVAVGTSDNAVWQAALAAVTFDAGDRVLVGENEWGGNLSSLARRCERAGASLGTVDSREDGTMDPAALADTLDDRVRVVCVTWLGAVNGAVTSAERIADAMSTSDAWLFVDAAQAFAHVTTDLSHPRFDVVTASPRKWMRGPRGTGFAVFSRRFLDRAEPLAVDQFSAPWTDGAPRPRDDARRFELAESPYAVRVGLAEAVRLRRLEDEGAIRSRVLRLAHRAREALGALPGTTVGEALDAPSGIATATAPGTDLARVVADLRGRGTNLSALGSTYAPLWFGTRSVPVLRLSPHAFNTEAEVDAAVDAIGAAMHRFPA